MHADPLVIPVIRRSAFQHCTSTLESFGLNVDRVLARANIPPWHHGNPDEMVPFRDMLRALDVGAGKTGDSRFGLMAALSNPMHYAAFGKVIAESVSLYDACRKSARLVKYLNSSSHIWVSRKPDGILLCRAPAPSWQMEQYVLGQMVGLVQMAAGRDWHPRDVWLSSPETHGLNDSELFADTTFHTGQPFLAVAVPNILLGTNLENWSDYAGDASVKMLRATAGAGDLVGSVSQVIKALLPKRYPAIEIICEEAGLSKRTLQRHLAKEGLTYRDLVGQVRFKMACKLLAESEMDIREIAYELGYASDTHFVRAFGHWAGITPGMYRAQRRLH